MAIWSLSLHINFDEFDSIFLNFYLGELLSRIHLFDQAVCRRVRLSVSARCNCKADSGRPGADQAGWAIHTINIAPADGGPDHRRYRLILAQLLQDMLLD